MPDNYDAFVQAAWLVDYHCKAGFYQQTPTDLTTHWALIARQLQQHPCHQVTIGTHYHWQYARQVRGNFGPQDLGEALDVDAPNAAYNPNYLRMQGFRETMANIVQEQKIWPTALALFDKTEQAIIKDFWQPPIRRSYDPDKKIFYPNTADGVVDRLLIDTTKLLEFVFDKPISHPQLLSLALS